jgi:hypothetical protein
MRGLLDGYLDAAFREVLPSELNCVLRAGWRVEPGGVLRLAGPRRRARRIKISEPAEVGADEYQDNDFAVSDRELAWTVASFGPRLGPSPKHPVPLEADPDMDYRLPGGELPADVLGYLRAMAGRGLTFASRALMLAHKKRLPGADELIAFVNTGIVGDVLVHGTHIHFTTARGEPSGWFDPSWFDDLEKFKLEAMAVLTMADAVGEQESSPRRR